MTATGVCTLTPNLLAIDSCAAATFASALATLSLTPLPNATALAAFSSALNTPTPVLPTPVLAFPIFIPLPSSSCPCSASAACATMGFSNSTNA